MAASQYRDRRKKAALERTKQVESSILTLTKLGLRDLADRLLLDDPEAVETCVRFVEAETVGNWHGRARAMMCRRLKHCTLSASQCQGLVFCITERLRSGHFSEQFWDQLGLSLYLDVRTTLAVLPYNRYLTQARHKKHRLNSPIFKV
jgi:hypothetical protein